MTKKHVAELKPENQQQVQTFIEDILQRSKLPGISVAMDVNGETLQAATGFSNSYTKSPINIDMCFELACMNKFIIALVVLEFVDDGLIDLEESISKYLPDFSGKQGDKIKVKNLLNHTAGYQGENMDDPDIAFEFSYIEFCRTFNDRPSLFEPGLIFDYSHSASVILRKIVEKASGKNSKLIINELIFDPLGIEVIEDKNFNTSLCVSGHQRNNTSKFNIEEPFRMGWGEFWRNSLGGPWITMTDLAKIGRSIVKDNSVISKNTKKLLLSSTIRLPGMFVGLKAEDPFYMFGLGCARFPNGSYGMSSSSVDQCCALRFDMETGIVIAIGINADAAYLRDYILKILFNSMLSEDAKNISSLSPVPNTNFSLNELVGTYEGSNQSRFVITLKNNILELRAGHNIGKYQDNSEVILRIFKNNNNDFKLLNSTFCGSIGFCVYPFSTEMNLLIGRNVFIRV